MKYYTPELWKMFNSESDEVREEADRVWTENVQAYVKRFETVKPRLSKKFLDLYYKHYGFHDFEIRNICLNHKAYGTTSNPISVEVVISNRLETFNLTYKKVTQFHVNYEEEEGRTLSWGFDHWGYDECLPVNDEVLSHEVLFASGAILLVHFRNRNLFISKMSHEELDD